MSLLDHLQAHGLQASADVPLGRLGYWRIGGPADVYVEVPDEAGLAVVLGAGAPVTLLGNGSNLLISDDGVRGVVVRLVGTFRETSFEDGDPPLVVAGAGVANAVLLRRLSARGLGGLACLAGVPGTVGGAIRLNAGTALGEIGAAVASVDLMLPGGKTRTLLPEQLGFAYRHAGLPAGAVVTRTRLRLRADPNGEEQALIAAHLARRKATQPLDLPSCGSVFKNPPGDYAGRLIETCGLKGMRLGDAQISPVHANFIVNLGAARASDVAALIRAAMTEVHARHGVILEPEVHAVGEIPGWPVRVDGAGGV